MIMKTTLRRILNKLHNGWNELFQSNNNILQSKLIPLNSCLELMKVFGWSNPPILNEKYIEEFSYVEDANERRRRDAESVLTLCRNLGHGTILEIGTAEGIMTASMAENAPYAQIYTINLPPEEGLKGVGGSLITKAFSYDDIGKYYREKDYGNIHQIYANTATWQPNIGEIDIAFVDGCHDTDFVINDTLKILPAMKKGGFICWHDCHPELRHVYNWIESAYQGVNTLALQGHLPGRIYWLRDSWCFIYQVI